MATTTPAATATTAKTTETTAATATATGTPGTATETQITETPEVEPEQPEAADDGGDDDVLSVSREELDEIKKHPQLNKLYRGMTKAHAAGREALAQQRTQYAQDLEIINAIKENPIEAAKIMAQVAGLQVLEQPKPKPEADAITQRLAQVVGPDIAKAFKPILEDAIEQRVKELVAPLQQETREVAATTLQARSETEVEQFKARHPNQVTLAIEKKMVELSHKFQAGEDSDPQEYMEGLFAMATGGQTKKDATKEVVTRMRSAAETQEPRTGVTPGKVEATFDTKGMNFDQAFDKAWEISKARRNQ